MTGTCIILIIFDQNEARIFREPELLGQPMRAPCMLGVERGHIASLGRRETHGDALLGVFGAV